MNAMRCARKVSLMIISDFWRPKVKVLAISAALLLASGGSALGAGGDLVWQSGAAATGKQEARRAAFDSAGNILLAGSGEANGGEGRVVKLRGDGTGPAWTATFNLGSALDVATAVAVDSNDDVVVTGYGNNGTNFDIHTVKYRAADGAVLWQNTYRGTAGGDDLATAVAVDELGNVYVGGYGQGSGGRDDALVLKYGPDGPNPDGTPLWVRTWNGAADRHDRILAIAAGTGGIAVTGESQNATPDFDAFTLKYDPAGALLWEKTYADSGDGRGNDVRLDLSGNVVMAGYVSNGSNRDLYVAKYPAAGGTALWVASKDNGSHDEANALCLDGAGNVYVTGTSLSAGTARDVYTLKLAAGDGAQLWPALYNSFNGNNEYGLALALDEAGDLFVAGYRDIAETGEDDFLLLKYGAASGTFFWAHLFNGTGHDDRAIAVGLAPDGKVVAAGWSDRWTAGTSDYDFYAIAVNPGALNPPTALTTQTISNTEIRLTWIDNSVAEDGFVIERRVGDTGTFGPVITLPADTISYNNISLIPDTYYIYRVKAASAASGDSPYSNEAASRTTIIEEQPPSWLFSYNGPDQGDDEPRAIAVGPDHHPVVTGTSFSLDSTFDYFTVKIDRGSIAQLWAGRYNDPDFESDYGTSVAVDGANRVVVTGFASLYGGGTGNTNDIYTLGYAADGLPKDAGGNSQSLWGNQYNGPYGSDDRSSAVAVATDDSDNTVVVGFGKNAAANDDIYVLKYLPEGTRAWAAVPFDGGGNDYPAAVAFHPSGDIYVAGRTTGAGNDDMFIAKYSGIDGSRLWTRTYPEAGSNYGNDYAEALAVDAAGNLYVAGYGVNAAGNGDAWLLKYDGAGNRQWARPYDGVGHSYDIAKAVAVDPIDGEVLVAGTTFVGAGNHDFVLLYYNAAGDLQWEKRIDRPATDEGVAAMGMDRFGIATVTGSSGNDILTMKLNHEGTIIGANLYNGGFGEDVPVGVAVNALSEAFVAGFSTNAAGNSDYVVFRANGAMLAPPYPFTGTGTINQIDLAWTDNAADDAGFVIERYVGACSDPDPVWGAELVLAANETGYAESGLPQGTTYCYRLRAYRSNGEFSRAVLRQVATGIPQAPTNLSTSVLSTTQIRLTWTDNTVAGESGYLLAVQRCEGASCTFSDTDPLFTVAAPASNWTDDSLCPATSYSYRVLAKKEGSWASAFSLPATATTSAVGGAPSGLTATRVSESEIRLNWTDNTADESGFQIERCIGAACTQLTATANQTSSNDSGLDIATVYTYRIRAYKNAANAPCSWETAWSTGASATTDLLSPDGLTAAMANSTTVNLAWSDRSGTETGFRIERCPGEGAACDEESEFALIANALANAIGFTDSEVCSAGTYTYRVRAEKSTAPAWQTTWALAAPVNLQAYSTPTGLLATVISEARVDLTWSDTNADESGFRLERCLDAVCEVIDRPGSATAFSDTGVAPNSAYSYRVQAYKTAVCSWQSLYSDPAPAATVPMAATAPGITAVNTTRIDLTWTDKTATETGYRLERCPGSGAACDEDTEFSLLTGLGANAAAYTDNSVCNGSTFTYRLRAEKTTAPAWQSAWTLFAAATTDTPVAPTNLTLANPNETTVSAAFDDTSTDESSFVLERCAGAGSACDEESEFALLKNFPPTIGGNLLLYHMEEASWPSGTAGAVLDSSGNGQHGTPYGAVPTTGGYFVNGGSFNGSTQYIATPVAINQNTGSPGATFEAWVYPTLSDGNYRHVISTENGGSDWSIQIYNGYWYVTNGFSRYSTGKAVTLNQWQHVAAVFDPASGVRFYLNNTAPYTTASLYYEASVANVTLGRYPTSSTATYYFGGKMDEVAIYNRPLIAAEIQGHYEAGIQRYNYADTTIAPATTYTYRARAIKTADCPWSVATVATLTTAPPPAPSGFTAIAATSTRINLAWTDNAASETAYRIERCPGAGAACDEESEFAPLTTLAAGAQAHADLTVCSGATYTYRVRAEKDNGPLWQSTWVTAQGSTASPSAPASLVVAGKSEERIDLSWNYASSDRTGFRVGRCTGDAVTCDTPAEFAIVADITTAGSSLSRSDAGLTGGATYTYRVWAYKSGVICPWEGPYSQVTEATIAPPAPTGFSATGGNTTRINLAWTDNTTSETAYRVERCPGTGTACDEDAEFALLTNLPANAVAYADNSVCNGTSYTYRVRAEKTDGPLWLTAWAGPAAGTPLAILAPASLTATRFSEVEIRLGWTDRTTDETGFRVERCTGDLAACVSDAQFSLRQSLGAGATAFNDTGLTPATSYTYRVKAYKDATCPWTSVASNSASAVTDLLAPGNLTATGGNTTRINLAWTDRTASETGFRVERCTGTGTACDEDTEFALLINLAANAAAHIDNSVCNGTSYTYRVRAEKTDGPIWQSTWGGPTAGTPLTILAPTGLTATRFSEVEIRLVWTDRTTDESGFRVERCTGDLAACVSDAQFSLRQTQAAGATTFNDTGLIPATAYTYRIKATKDTGCTWISAASNSASARTDLLAPTSFTATAMNTTRIDLVWADRTSTETGFRVERCTGTGTACDEDAEFAFLTNRAANVASYSDTTACSGSTFTYRVRAESTTPSWVSAWTTGTASTAVPVAPTLSITSFDHAKVVLSWSTLPADITELRVERCTGETCINFSQIYAAAPGSTGYTDTTVSASTPYRYRVQPYKSVACAWPEIYSNIVAARTWPAAITNLAATPVNSMVVRLTWSDTAPDEDGYEIEAQVWNGNFTHFTTVGPDTTSFLDRDASPVSTYRYRVRVVKGSDKSLYSNEATATTPAFQSGDTSCPP